MRRSTSELAGVGWLLIDGNNLLHRVAGSPDPAARRQLIARLRLLPPGVRMVLALDGPPDPGGPLRQRIDAHLEVRHAGHRDADSLILALVAEHPFLERGACVAVTDDRSLADRVRAAGGRARRLAWLLALLEGSAGRPVAPSVAAPYSAGSAAHAAATEAGTAGDEEAERPSWRPGRGATRKHGNPHRGRPPGRQEHPPGR